MHSSRRMLMGGIISLAIYMAILMIQNLVIKNVDYKKVVLTNIDIQAGTKIEESMVNIKKVNTKDINSDNLIYNLNDIVGKIAIEKIYRNDLNLKGRVIDENQYIFNKGDKTELVSIKVNTADQSVSYQIKEGNNVNLYFIGKSEIIKDSNIKKDITYLNTSNELNCCIKILDNYNVFGIYDKNGIKIPKINTDNKAIDTVAFFVNESDAKLIYSLKSLGRFEISMK